MANPNFDNFDINNFNSFIEQANQALTCGPQCQYEKEANQLQNDYSNAETNLAIAPYLANTAEENYIVFTQGQVAYKKLENERLTSQYNQYVTAFQNNFNKQVNAIQNNINTYSGLAVNYKNVYDLYKKYQKENSEFKKKYYSENSNVVTNDRKTYYENQEVETLNFVYIIILIIYAIVVIVYFFSAFFYASSFNWKIKLAIFILLLLLPFVSTQLLSLIVSFVYKIYDLLPKNVYKSL